jgi:hypothetical protein
VRNAGPIRAATAAVAIVVAVSIAVIRILIRTAIAVRLARVSRLIVD